MVQVVQTIPRRRQSFVDPAYYLDNAMVAGALSTHGAKALAAMVANKDLHMYVSK